MKKKTVIIIIAIAVVIVAAVAAGIFVGVKGGVFGKTVEITDSTGKYSENNDSLVTEELEDITYDRYVLWANDVEDGAGTYYLTEGESTILLVYTEEVSEDALETLEGENPFTYEEVYNILAANIEAKYVNVEETSRDMITVGDNVDAMTIKFFTNNNTDDDNTTTYEHWITVFLYNGNLYYFVLAEPQEVSTEIEYNIVLTSIICK